MNTQTNDFIAAYHAQEEQRKKDAANPKLRKSLRIRLLANALFDDQPITEVRAEFDGYGDSGQVYDALREEGEHANLFKDTNMFLRRLVDTHVTWDWYNNEGGGGTIIWDLQADKIIIDGYYNVTHQEHQDEIKL